MKDKIIESLIVNIKQKYPTYTNNKILEIKYGLESIYLTVSKLILIFIIAWLFGIIKEFLLFTFFYNIIRMPSFGLHAKKSSTCLIISLILFIAVPYLSKYIYFNSYFNSYIGIILILLIFRYSPADTEKRPIINKKRRNIYKFVSTIISITYILTSLIIKNQTVSNLIIFSVAIQAIMISPITYKIFNLKYNNYLNYQINE